MTTSPGPASSGSARDPSAVPPLASNSTSGISTPPPVRCSTTPRRAPSRPPHPPSSPSSPPRRAGCEPRPGVRRRRRPLRPCEAPPRARRRTSRPPPARRRESAAALARRRRPPTQPRETDHDPRARRSPSPIAPDPLARPATLLAALPHLQLADRLVAEALVYGVAQLRRLKARCDHPALAGLRQGLMQEPARQARAAVIGQRRDEVDAAVAGVVVGAEDAHGVAVHSRLVEAKPFDVREVPQRLPEGALRPSIGQVVDPTQDARIRGAVPVQLVRLRIRQPGERRDQRDGFRIEAVAGGLEQGS